jgi:hypothetical protein
MNAPIVMMERNVKNLPEVGEPIMHIARSLDERAALLQKQIDNLNSDRKNFIDSLTDDWSDEELTNAGIFGFTRK